jgi:hypothetical protein
MIQTYPQNVDDIVVEIEFNRQPSDEELLGFRPLDNIQFMAQVRDRKLLVENEEGYTLEVRITRKEGYPKVFPNENGKYTVIYSFEPHPHTIN